MEDDHTDEREYELNDKRKRKPTKKPDRQITTRKQNRVSHSEEERDNNSGFFLEEENNVADSGENMFFGDEASNQLPDTSSNPTESAVKTLHEELTGHSSIQPLANNSINGLTGNRDNNAYKERLVVRRKLRSYYDKFQKSFNTELKKEFLHLDKKSDEELQTLLSEVKFAVFWRTQPELVKQTYFHFLEFNEHYIGAQGLSQTLRRDPLVSDLLEEINIKYQNEMYVEPEYRLILATLGAAHIVRKINKISSDVPSVLTNLREELEQNSVEDEILLEKYNDL